MKKALFGFSLIFLISTTLLFSAFVIQPGRAMGTIYIRNNGLIDPPEAPIFTLDSSTYTLTGNIYSELSGIVIERDNVTLDGARYTLLGTNTINCWGIYLSNRRNVTIQNLTIANFGNTIGQRARL